MNTNVRDHLNENLRTQTTTLTGNQDDFALDGPFAYLKCNNASELVLRGALIDSGNLDGARVIIEALNSTVRFKHQDTGSSTSNRLITPDGGDLVLTAFGRALMVYDGTALRWRVNRASSGLASNIPVIDHGTGTSGRDDDDHSLYLMKRTTRGRITRAASQSIPNNTITAISFDTEREDPDDMHESVTNPTRVTIADAGYYEFGGSVEFAQNATGVRALHLRVNGSVLWAVSGVVNAGSGSAVQLNMNSKLNLAASDYSELTVYQNSGGALNVVKQSNWSPEFWWQRLG
jgi:hypothetical protein